MDDILSFKFYDQKCNLIIKINKSKWSSQT